MTNYGKCTLDIIEISCRFFALTFFQKNLSNFSSWVKTGLFIFKSIILRGRDKEFKTSLRAKIDKGHTLPLKFFFNLGVFFKLT